MRNHHHVKLSTKTVKPYFLFYLQQLSDRDSILSHDCRCWLERTSWQVANISFSSLVRGLSSTLRTAFELSVATTRAWPRPSRDSCSRALTPPMVAHSMLSSTYLVALSTFGLLLTPQPIYTHSNPANVGVVMNYPTTTIKLSHIDDHISDWLSHFERERALLIVDPWTTSLETWSDDPPPSVASGLSVHMQTRASCLTTPNI